MTGHARTSPVSADAKADKSADEGAVTDGFFLAPPPAGREAGSARAWVYRQVLDAVRDGRLAAGTRLPSARRLATAWQVARSAVDDALAQLQTEGLIERRVGDGSFVARHLPVGTRAAVAAPAPAPPPAPVLLHPLLTDTASFPLERWRRLVAHSLDDPERHVLSYGQPAGLPALREATAQYLRLTRGMDCQPGQVLIVDSALHAVELIVQVLFEPGDVVALEDPGFAGAAALFVQSQLQVVGIPVDDEGFDIAAVRRDAPRAAALYLHPLNQFPTGCRTSATRRREILEHADASGAWVIEGDHLAEIVHDGAAPPALWRSDRAERVLYVGTFNGVTFPTLRLAYLVLPEALVPVFSAVRGMMGDHSPLATQGALAALLQGGHLSAHLRTLRTRYAARRAAFVAAVRQQLGDSVRLGPTSSGVHACLHLPPACSDTGLAAALVHEGVRALPLSTLCLQPRGLNALVVGYGAQDEAQTAAGLGRVASVLAAGGGALVGGTRW